MTPRPRSRPHTGGGDGPTPRDRTHGGDDGDGPGPGGRRRAGAGATPPAHSITAAQTVITQAAHLGRPGGGAGSGTHSGSGSGGAQQGQLPPGHTRDVNGDVHGPDGRYADDPFAPPRPHTRDTEYPNRYPAATHEEMVTRYTLEGQEAGGWPRDANGNRIPRDQLTWVDEHGREIDYSPDDPITYDHDPPVVQHWNDEGRFSTRAERDDWYTDPDHMRPRTRSENSRHGGSLKDRYNPETGDGYGE